MQIDEAGERALLVTRYGSHAYGTATAESDLDVRGVFVATWPYYLGFAHQVEQVHAKTWDGQEADVELFELRKFFRLASDCNPNILEILFTDDSDLLFLAPDGARLREGRRLFLSQKVRFTYAGYAHAQLRRIETHRRWLLNPPEAPPKRADFGLPERTVAPADQLAAVRAMVQKRLDEWNLGFDDLDDAAQVHWKGRVEDYLTELTASLGYEDVEALRGHAAARSLGVDTNFIALLDRERAYHARQQNWHQYQEWRANRNPARAAMETESGYDRKHAAQLFRLMRMGHEILSTGEVRVRRPDAQEILDIRNGAWSYDRLVAWAKEQEAALEELYRSGRSPLPKRPNRDALDEMCMEIVSASLHE